MKNKNINKLNVREVCLKSLVNYEKDKKYSNIELNEAVERYGFNDLDRSFFTKLFYGVIEKKLTLDYYIDCLRNNNKKIESDILNILRMGLYQILYMDKVPDNAACNESVELAKKLNNKQATGFINAVLRNFLRNKDEYLKSAEKINSENRHFEIKYSFSYDIIKIWKESYGIEITAKLLDASTIKPDLTLTVNYLKISREEYLNKLNSLGINAEKTELSEYGVNILDNIPVKKLYGFDEGLFFVQDEASQVCALETGAKSGDIIFDCCAAPGGKSLFMAQMMRNNGRIICFDLHKNKLNLINKSANRLGIDIVETYEHDSAIPIQPDIMQNIDNLKADIVLCDVPCSGLGVINKKPEIKYKSVDEINKLPEIQYKILDNCSNYVKPGGVLLYSTCTLNKKENEEIAEKFLDTHKNFKCEIIKTFFPFERKIDGFFLVKMRLLGV